MLIGDVVQAVGSIVGEVFVSSRMVQKVKWTGGFLRIYKLY